MKMAIVIRLTRITSRNIAIWLAWFTWNRLDTSRMNMNMLQSKINWKRTVTFKISWLAYPFSFDFHTMTWNNWLDSSEHHNIFVSTQTIVSSSLLHSHAMRPWHAIYLWDMMGGLALKSIQNSYTTMLVVYIAHHSKRKEPIWSHILRLNHACEGSP